MVGYTAGRSRKNTDVVEKHDKNKNEIKTSLDYKIIKSTK